MGPGWAKSAAAPFRFFKSFTSEGGIRVPLIVYHPDMAREAKNTSSALTHVSDLMPTFLDIAQADYPKEFRGREVMPPTGKSLLSLIEGKIDDVRPESGIGFELFEMKAFIQGPWKISRLPEPFGSGMWELFNLYDDPGETKNLAGQDPEIMTSMRAAWDAYAIQNEVFDHNGHFDAIYRTVYGVK
jgi:arylsulfatase